MARGERPGPGDPGADPEAVTEAALALEQEVKLAFVSPEAARQAVESAGGRLVRSRRLIDDRLLDWRDRRLQREGVALRVRRDGDRCLLTFKGPALAGPVKTREELETEVAHADTLDAILSALGFEPRFRSQKFRTEYALGRAHIAVDEAPVGVFVEIEATPDDIAGVAAVLGRSPADYRLESYPTLWREWCRAHGLPFGDMLLHQPPP